ncbi:DUF6894 family protein [Methylobacterium sp. A54F]
MRFYFNVCDGTSLPDCEGADFTDHADAMARAIRLSIEYLKRISDQHPRQENWEMEVTDERGLTLFRLDFQNMEALVEYERRS